MDKWLVLDEMHFGFTKSGGCQKALFALESVVEYFMRSGNGVYLAV